MRDALEVAISQLQENSDIEDSFREAHLDQDRKNIPGSPSLAETILNKIDISNVFVADVTPVGNVTSSEKKLINSNVAIELGYALKSLSDRALLMVMNGAYGNRDDLPFDLRHKSGPIIFNLKYDAKSEDIKKEKKNLIANLKAALTEIVKSVPKQSLQNFPEQEPNQDNPGIYFDQSKPLLEFGDDLHCFFPYKSVTYVRLIPHGNPLKLGRVESQKIAEGENHLKVFSTMNVFGNLIRSNRYGALAFSSDSQNQIFSASQMFKSGELWGIDGHVLKDNRATRIIPTGLHETIIARGVNDFIDFATRKLGFGPSFIVEIGMTNVEGYKLAMPSNYWEQYWGPVEEKHIIRRFKITSKDSEEINTILLEYFKAVFDAAGHERPDNFNGFPPASANHAS